MLARRSVLAFLGLAPVAATGAIAAVVRPEVLVAGVDVTEAGIAVGCVLMPARIGDELDQWALTPDPAGLARLSRALRAHAVGVQSLSPLLGDV